MGHGPQKQTPISDDRTPLQKLADLTARVVHVPKEEVPKHEPKKRERD